MTNKPSALTKSLFLFQIDVIPFAPSTNRSAPANAPASRSFVVFTGSEIEPVKTKIVVSPTPHGSRSEILFSMYFKGTQEFYLIRKPKTRPPRERGPGFGS